MPLRVKILTSFLLAFQSAMFGQEFNDLALDAGIFYQYDGTSDYGGGVSFHDFDGDGDDDISLCQRLTPPLFYENIDGQFEEKPAVPGLSNGKSLQWVDFDNDGDVDLFISRAYGPPQLFERIGDWSFNDITFNSGITTPNANTFGSNWGDYNNDQLLDLYICQYEAEGIENFLFKNNGDGTFTDVSEITNSGGGSHYSFQAVFLDYDRDGWQDIFIINDRDFSPNIMLHNNMGVFEDVTAESMGLYYIFSMSNSVADFDNDGDQDIFISNSVLGNYLHRNEGDGTFTEVGDELEISANAHCWAGQWLDYNLDGRQDLFVCSSPFFDLDGQNQLFRNTQDGTFVLDLSPGFEDDAAWSHSSAVADYNNDGVFDIFVMNMEPDISSLWTSSGVESNFLKVSVEGTESNKDAIGSWIEIWANGEYQMRYTFCGEGYLTQNSDVEIFGLSDHDQVDSLKVTWPNGNLESWYDVDVNQNLHLLEGSTLQFSLNTDPNLQICPGDSVILSAPDYASYLWSTGDTTQSLIITGPGSYEVQAWTDLGEEHQSDVVNVTMFPQTVILADVQLNPCHDDTVASIELNNVTETGLISCDWDSGNNGTSLTNLPAGNYQYSWIDQNSCVTTGLIDLTDPQPLEISMIIHHVSCFGEQDGAVEVNASGGTGDLSLNWGGNDPPQNLGPGAIEVVVTDENLCSAQMTAVIEEPDLLEVEIDFVEIVEGNDGSATALMTGGTPGYNIYWSTGDSQATIQNLGPGEYGVWVIDDHQCLDYESITLMDTGLEKAESIHPSIFPNPFDQYLQIHWVNEMDNLKILDSTGRVVLEITQGFSSPVLLDLSYLPTGAYFCKIQSATLQHQHVILKRH